MLPNGARREHERNLARRQKDHRACRPDRRRLPDGGKRLHLVCRDPKNGYIGVIALHRGKKIKSFHLDAIRAEARNLRREGARA